MALNLNNYAIQSTLPILIYSLLDVKITYKLYYQTCYKQYNMMREEQSVGETFHENICKLMQSTRDESGEIIESESSIRFPLPEHECGDCSRLNHRLSCTEKQYHRILSENYAGQLTIRYLKQKNRQLLQKISKNTKQDKSSSCKSSRKSVQISQSLQSLVIPQTQKKQSNDLPFIETFNPKKLKSLLRQFSENGEIKQIQSNLASIGTIGSRLSILETSPISLELTNVTIEKSSSDLLGYEQKQNKVPGNNNEKSRLKNKQGKAEEGKRKFNLYDLKMKAQKRLYVLKRQNMSRVQNCINSQQIRRREDSNPQFMFY